MDTLQVIYHLTVINILFVFSSLPIFTIGISIRALNDSCKIQMENEMVYPFKQYFQSFKNNFFEGLKDFLLLLVPFLSIVFFLNLISLAGRNSVLTVLLLSLFCLFISISLVISSLYFMVDRNKKDNIVQHLRRILMIGFQNINWTVVIVVIDVLYLFLFVVALLSFKLLSFYYFSIGFSILGMINQKIVKKIKTG